MDLTPQLHHRSLTTFDSPDAAPALDGSVTDYVVLSKATTGYDEFVRVRTASEAWAARKQLATTHADRKFFVRAQRVFVIGPSSPEAREDRDLWQEAWRTGNDHLVPASQQAEYRLWASKKTTNKYARWN
jgi:hypothetical protein